MSAVSGVIPGRRSPGRRDVVRGRRTWLAIPASYLVILIVLAITLVPMLYLIVGGFSTTPQLNDNPDSLPHQWVWSNYGSILSSSVFWQAIGNIGQNVEVPQFTEALYDARELAMSRMQAEAEALHAEGIVGVQLLSLPHRWGGHTTEFFAIGTAIRPLRADHTIAKPQLVLPLVDN